MRNTIELMVLELPMQLAFRWDEISLEFFFFVFKFVLLESIVVLLCTLFPWGEIHKKALISLIDTNDCVELSNQTSKQSNRTEYMFANFKVLIIHGN